MSAIYDQIVDIIALADTHEDAADMIINMLEAEGILNCEEDDYIDEDFLPPQTRDELEI